MNLLREYIRELLTEAAKGPQDLPGGIWVKITEDDWGVEVSYVNKLGNALNQQASVNGVVMVENIPEDDDSLGRCGGAWMIGSSQAATGWGPMLYDVAMEYATMKGGGLMADRGSVSGDARKVWNYYMANRGDVTGIQMDDRQNTLTPEEEDNCSQKVAIKDEQGNRTDTSWTMSPLSKRWIKPPTTIEALRAAGKLVWHEAGDHLPIRDLDEEGPIIHLEQYIRELLVEKSLTGRKLERVAKHIGSAVLQSLKDEEIKTFFSKPDRSFPLEFRLDYTPPEKLAWLRHVIIKMNPPMGNQQFNASGAYEYSIDAPEEERRNSDLILNLFMPVDYTDKEIDQFGTKIMGTIRHELEHSGQPTEDLQATQKKIKDEDDIWSSLENIEAYYIDKAETPSHVSDWVLQAKKEGVEAADVIDWELENVYATALHKGYTAEELKPVMERIREVYQYYLMSRWPQQDWPAEMRDQ